jgi:hypothetical protein
VSLDLHSGVDDASAELFAEQLRARRRELELEGLAWSDIDVSRLTELLAERLTAVVPASVEVRVENLRVWIADAGVDIGELVADSEDSAEDRIALAAGRLLEVASDEASEVTAEPWPASAGRFAGGFPPHQSVISDGQLLMSYGDPANPLLMLAPIPVNDVLI